jgi:hypothetical protein
VAVKLRRGSGALDCDFELGGGTLTLPAAALSTLPTTGATSFSVAHAVEARSDDHHGRTLLGQAGRGVSSP